MKRIVDEVNIVAQAGNGGRGCDSHVRISNRKSLRTGGEGGRGGDVIMRADPNIASLSDFNYHHRFVAESGGLGGSSHKRGKRGEDLVIPVPCGTMIFEKGKRFLIRDLVQPGDEVVLLQGGRGGTGNEGGKEPEPGQPGEALEMTLSLRIPAEVFFVGLPNSGKSQLLGRLTHARAKVEAYPFSTKQLELGIYESAEFKQIRLCELPGIYRENLPGSLRIILRSCDQPTACNHRVH